MQWQFRFGTTDTTQQRRITWNASNWSAQGSTDQTGSRLSTQSDLTLLAGRNLAACAATIDSAQGQVLLQAGQDLTLASGQQIQQLQWQSHSSKKGLLKRDPANMQTQHALVLLALLSSLLTACQSVGVQYRFPSAMEPSAELQGKEGGMINTFDAEGCYVGRTSITDKVRLRAGDPVVLAYEVVLNASAYNTIYNVPPITCTRLFSFIPQPDARYVLRGDISYVDGKNMFGKSIAIPSCEAGLQQRLPDGSLTDVPVTTLGLYHKRWNCLQARPPQPHKKEDDEE